MLRQWIQLLPQHVGNGWLLTAGCGAIAGLVLWVAGAHFSRLLIGLAAVTIGAAIGMLLPRWMQWNISGAGPAVALALMLGVSGYLLQRLWIGVFLGVVLAAWAFLVTWVACGGPASISPNQKSFDAWWTTLPPNVAAYLPYTCGSAMVVGILLALIWPRLGIAAAWSAAGVSLIAGLGSAAIAASRPQLVSMFPQQLGSQLIAIIFLIGVGVLLQWRTAGQLAGNFSTRSSRPSSPPPQSEGD